MIDGITSYGSSFLIVIGKVLRPVIIFNILHQADKRKPLVLLPSEEGVAVNVGTP
jgi:hypothetical protein